MVDSNPSKFNAEKLREIKNQHEDRIRNKLEFSIPNVTFVGLEIAAKEISKHGEYSSDENFGVISPDLKISKNNLGQPSRKLIAMGLSRTWLVRKSICLHFGTK